MWNGWWHSRRNSKKRTYHYVIVKMKIAYESLRVEVRNCLDDDADVGLMHLRRRRRFPTRLGSDPSSLFESKYKSSNIVHVSGYVSLSILLLSPGSTYGAFSDLQWMQESIRWAIVHKMTWDRVVKQKLKIEILARPTKLSRSRKSTNDNEVHASD